MSTPPQVNSAGLALYEHTAPIMAGDAQIGWAGLFLCAAIGAMMQDSDLVVTDTPDMPGWAILLDPDLCPVPWLPWLAWLYGAPVTPAMSVQQQRDTIRTLAPHARGTVGALRAAALPHLSGDAPTVEIIERDGAPEFITVITYTSETPDTAVVGQALEAAKLTGLKLTHHVYPGWTIAAMEAHYAAGTIATLEGDFATVTAFESDTP